MCTAPGRAPCSYSSGSRTSRTTVPGRAAMASAAPAVSTSRIWDLVSFSSSRKLAIVHKTLPGRSEFPDKRYSAAHSPDLLPETEFGDPPLVITGLFPLHARLPEMVLAPTLGLV